MKHTIEKKSYGFRNTMCTDASLEVMTMWVEDSVEALKTVEQDKFSVLGDIRNVSAFTDEVASKLKEGQQLYLDKGIQRSSIIVNSPTLALQFKKISKTNGLYKYERYFDTESDPNWERKAELWLSDAIDPDKE